MRKTPNLRFKEFSGDWEEKKLQSIVSKKKKGKNALYAQQGNILLNNEYMENNTEPMYVENEIDVNENDILILWDGSQAGKMYTGFSGVLGSTFTAITLNKYNCNKFIHQQLMFNLDKIQIAWREGSGVPHVAKDFIENFKVKVPLKEEQEKIASFFSLIDDKISLQSEKLEMLKDYKKGMMQKIFSRELRFKDDEGRDYSEWEEIKLGDIIDKGKAGGTPKSTINDYYNGDINFLSISDMTTQGKYINYTEKTITKLGLENSSAWLVPKNSLIYSMYASVGFVSINKIELATSQAMFSMIINENTNMDYVYHYLSYFKDNGIQAFIETGTQGNINANTVKNIVIPYPTIEEQNKIALCISSLESKIELEQEKLSNLNEYKKGLLQQMFV